MWSLMIRWIIEDVSMAEPLLRSVPPRVHVSMCREEATLPAKTRQLSFIYLLIYLYILKKIGNYILSFMIFIFYLFYQPPIQVCFFLQSIFVCRVFTAVNVAFLLSTCNKWLEHSYKKKNENIKQGRDYYLSKIKYIYLIFF